MTASSTLSEGADGARHAVGPSATATADGHERPDGAGKDGTVPDSAAPDSAAPDDAQDDTAPGTAGSKHPPRWLPRALALGIVAVFVGIFAWNALGALKSLWVAILIAFFLSLALEPATVWLVRRGWRRPAAAAVTLLGSLAAIVAVMALFGNLFVQQVVELGRTLPEYYGTLRSFVLGFVDLPLPEPEELVGEGLDQFGSDLAASALVVGSALLSGLFWSITILLVAYYLLAAGPRFRRAVCRWVPPDHQDEVLHLWGVVQRKVSDYIDTRLVLALISTVVTCAFLLILRTPYAIPLAVFVGVVSQFVPTIGAYLGGALPVMVALTGQGLWQAGAVLVFVVAYQQVENLWLAPMLSERALEMNAAVSLLVVLAFGAVFGALGAFLALPVAATIQAMATTYLRRHELIESHMFNDPEDKWVAAG
ncbi:AI-2E family transporter [Myceligenerans salitolerans]|uniref:AI-2E family transporter n=1 Tax=Myceligenerans salitolerans TaxID=1230528 RepID=A0ABS3ICW8_9MICO|nr:AI-2E family transporter [Myceligenerans salitolerans]MBO0610273.1 AI-2E family transporter [Myceligenerans salitolerans]